MLQCACLFFILTDKVFHVWTLWLNRRPEVKSIQLSAVDPHADWQQTVAAVLFLFSKEAFHLDVICRLQTPGRRHTDSAEPSGELWTTRSPADPTGDPHHPPLRWQCPGRLAHTAEESTGDGRMGGECCALCLLFVSSVLNSVLGQLGSFKSLLQISCPNNRDKHSFRDATRLCSCIFLLFNGIFYWWRLL